MATLTFTNNTGLTINDIADVSQTVDVYGLTVGSVTGVSVSLVGLTHSHSDDLDMLLVGASGRNLAFWTDIGSDITGPANDLSNLSVTISDSGATALPNDGGVPVSGGTYKPASHDITEGDSAFGLTGTTILHPATGGTDTFGSAFAGFVASGTWTLIVADDGTGDTGTLQGWGLTIVTNAISIGQVGSGVADTLDVIFNGTNSGSYSHNGRPVVGFSGVSNVTFEGLGGNDTLNITHTPGGAQFYSFVADTIAGSFPTVRYFDLTEVVNLTTGSGADTFQFHDATSAVINIFAGLGADRIAIFNSQDLTESTITGVETLQFGDVTLLTATLLGSQFGAGKITAVQGDIGTHNLIVNAASDVDLSGVTFTNWVDGTDTITINGSASGESLTGSSRNDIINGNGGGDTINGGAGNDSMNGGAGADTMRGGGENDTYVVDSTGDKAIESAGQGTDLVKAGASFTLGAEVENLTLTGAAAKGTGNGGANTINGNASANELFGLGNNDGLDGAGGNDTLDAGSGNDRVNGGVGLDSLTGGIGLDTFVFDAAVNSKAIAGANADIIADFNPKDDTIELLASMFPKLKVGVLKNKAFDSGKKKPAKDKHLVYYDEKKGNLWYDANGKKQKGKGDVLIAKLDPGLDLTAGDILVA